jgi:hypothetical protein
MNKIISIVLSTLLGLLFIASGALKMMPLEFLENELLYRNLGTEISVLFEARAIIASEFILGALLIFRLFLPSTARLAFYSLIIYTVYLTIVIALYGNKGNCGCFGNQIDITPLEGILKNILMGAMAFWLFKKSPAPVYRPWKKWTTIGMIAVGTLLPFVLYPIDLPQPITYLDPTKAQPSFDVFYTTPGVTPPAFDFRKEKCIIIFASLTCSNCKMIVSRAEIIKKNHPNWPIYLIVNGDKNLDLPSFLEETKLEHIPYSFFNKGDELIKVTGPQLPLMLLMENGKAISKLNYYNLNEEELSPLFP